MKSRYPRLGYVVLPLYLICFILIWCMFAEASSYFQGPALIEQVIITATSAGTTILTKDSQTNQVFTGSTTQNIRLPDATTIPQGRRFYIGNESTGNLTVKLNDNTTTLAVIEAGNSAAFRLEIQSSNGSWNTEVGLSVVRLTTDVLGILPVANGGTGVNTLTNHGLVVGQGTSPVANVAAGTAGQVLVSGGASADPAWSSATFPLTTTAPSAIVSNTNNVISSLTGATPNRLLRTDGSAVSWAQAALTTDVSGILPVTNGGTGTGTAFTSGSVVFADGSGVYAQDNPNFFWDDTNNFLGLNASATPTSTFHIAGTMTATPKFGMSVLIAPTAFTDNATLAAGTAAAFSVGQLVGPTLAATNTTVTTTDAATLNITGAVRASTNQTITNATGLNIATVNVNAGGGAPTQSYGLKVAAMSGATQNYAAAFTGGSVGIGVATPSSLLHVSSPTNGLTRIRLTNGNSSTLARAVVEAINDSSMTTTISQQSSGFTPVGINLANGGSLESTGVGGLSVAATNAAGTLRFYSGGTTQRMGLSTAGALQLNAYGAGVLVTDGSGNVTASSAGVGIQLKDDLNAAATATTVGLPNSQRTITGTNTYRIENGNKNLLANPSFESTTASTGWTVAGTVTPSGVTTAIDGVQALSMSLSSTNGTILTQNYTIPAGATAALLGAQMEVEAYVRVTTANIQVCAMVDSTERSCTTVPITSANNYMPIRIFFEGAGAPSTTMGIKIKSTTSDSSTVVVDAMYLGLVKDLGGSSQATYYGGMTQTGIANCSWGGGGASLTAFVNVSTSDSDCTNPWVTAGGITAVASTNHQAQANNMPAGEYQVFLTGIFSSDAANTCLWRLTDGTNSWQPQGISGPGNTGFQGLFFHVTYASPGSRTFTLQTAKNTAGTCFWNNDRANAEGSAWKFFRFPTQQQTVVDATQASNIWSGFHDSTCSWARTNAAYGDPTADATCNFTQRQNVNFGTVTSALSGSDKLPGIVFTPTLSGYFQVCGNAYGAPNVTALAATLGVQMIDNSAAQQSESVESGLVASNYQVFPNCGIFSVSAGTPYTVKLQTKASAGQVTLGGNGGSAIEWTVLNVSSMFPNPLLVGSLNTPYQGVTVDAVAKLNCDSGSAITSQLGSWVSSIGNVSAGACTVTLASGTFSQTPYCIAGVDATLPALGLIVSANATSSTSVTIDCEDDASTACTAYDVVLNCKGVK